MRAVYIAAALLGAVPSSVLAQAHSHAAPNGGQIVEIGKLEVEMVATSRSVTLYVTDEKEQKVDSASLDATATILSTGNQQRKVELKPAGENRLTGAYDFPVEGKFRASIVLRRDGTEVGRGRFNLDLKR